MIPDVDRKLEDIHGGQRDEHDESAVEAQDEHHRDGDDAEDEADDEKRQRLFVGKRILHAKIPLF